MIKAKNFSTTTRSNFNKKKKKKIIANLVLKKKLFLSLLVNDYILMYLKTTILCIYNFLILYECLFEVFFFLYTLALASLKF